MERTDALEECLEARAGVPIEGVVCHPPGATSSAANRLMAP